MHAHLPNATDLYGFGKSSNLTFSSNTTLQSLQAAASQESDVSLADRTPRTCIFFAPLDGVWETVPGFLTLPLPSSQAPKKFVRVYVLFSVAILLIQLSDEHDQIVIRTIYLDVLKLKCASCVKKYCRKRWHLSFSSAALCVEPQNMALYLKH